MTQTIYPDPLYHSCEDALDWLARAFGFEEVLRYTGASGYVNHAEMKLGDAHYERAKAAGAEITEELVDQEYGDRRYTARDPEGHKWFFATQLRRVEPQEWGATVA